MKRQVRIGSYNLWSYVGGEEGRLQLSVMEGELEVVGIGLYGLQKLRWLCAGEFDIIVPSSVWGHRGERD